jgi:UDP-glucose 4-epimerase
MRILVTGGAGYIGSHTVKLLGQEGHDVVVFDNLSTGHDWAVLYGDLVVGDLAHTNLLKRTIKNFSPDVVMHFAASIQVEESTRRPLLYYQNNVANTLNLLNVMLENRISRFLYSSTAAVYGIPAKVPVDETAPLCPINPYGASKVMVENILGDLARASGLKYIVLRYFNVAGADPEGQLGQVSKDATHLIMCALKTAKGEFSKLALYGTDYDTPDGTCVRDYVHVTDLAAAHLYALQYLLVDEKPELRHNVMNCGYGHGFSVKEVIRVVKQVTGVDFLVEQKPRRPGDAPLIIANSDKIRMNIGWKPQYDNLEFIVKTAWEWENKYGSGRVK